MGYEVMGILLILLMLVAAQGLPRFWVCLHWAHPDGIEWTSTLINGEDQWEYLQEKYPGSYKGKCTREE